MPSQECKSRKLAQVETNWTDRSPPPDIISNQTTRRSNRERKQTNGIEWTIRKQKRSSERETGTHCSTGSPWRRRAEGWGVGRRIRRRRRRRAGGKLRTPSFEFERAKGIGEERKPLSRPLYKIEIYWITILPSLSRIFTWNFSNLWKRQN